MRAYCVGITQYGVTRGDSAIAYGLFVRYCDDTTEAKLHGFKKTKFQEAPFAKRIGAMLDISVRGHRSLSSKGNEFRTTVKG